VLEHPLGGERSEGVTRRARQAVDQLVALLRKSDATRSPGVSEPARAFVRPPSIQAGLEAPATTITIPDTPEAILAAFCEREWCDGLPIVPPTEERVRAMLGGTQPDRLLG
jgi:hypothetical protein